MQPPRWPRARRVAFGTALRPLRPRARNAGTEPARRGRVRAKTATPLATRPSRARRHSPKRRCRRAPRDAGCSPAYRRDRHRGTAATRKSPSTHPSGHPSARPVISVTSTSTFAETAPLVWLPLAPMRTLGPSPPSAHSTKAPTPGSPDGASPNGGGSSDRRLVDVRSIDLARVGNVRH